MKRQMRKIDCVHFVGIGGSGMSGIAEVMLSLGYKVQGSDIQNNEQVKRLKLLGAVIFIGHDKKNIANSDVVVVSSAIKEENPEVLAAKLAMKPVVARAEMLAELMRFCYSIAVAGTHGKTTTTSLVTSILATGGLDPTFVIGGRLKSINSNAKLGLGNYLVAEADESDASFVHLKPMLAIVTNIDADHMDTYQGDLEQLRQGFINFLHNLPFYGIAVVCIDDPGIKKIISNIGRTIVTYGISKDADIVAENIIFFEDTSTFNVVRKNIDQPLKIHLNFPGIHNIQNALAAIAVATELNVADNDVVKALKNFTGIERRFQNYGEISTTAGNVILIDDYGHHPTEITATINAIRDGWPTRRLVMVFQPHRYTRTRDLLNEFAIALSEVDILILCEVYPASEPPIIDADGNAIKNTITAMGILEPLFVESLKLLPNILKKTLKENDLLLTMGAGDIGSWVAKLPLLLGPEETK